MALEIGVTVDGRYRVVEKLAQGGMGAVYRAWDTRLSRHVALKEMIPQPELDEQMLAELRKQFQHEAQVLGTLKHPNLVRVTDYFSWEGNEYLVMDFVEGESLSRRIERLGAQPESDVLHWAGMLLDALSYCHKQSIIHRDIKPQNIIITPEGQAVLVDFGLVKLWDPNDPDTRTVMRGAGTPQYAPPEQYDAGLGYTDPRSDVYALGATMYHALTGNLPPTATQRMADPSCFLPPHRINVVLEPDTESAVLRAMAVAKDQRFQTAEEMAVALRVSPRQTPTSVPDPRQPITEVLPADELPKPRKRRLGVWAAAAAGGMLCIVVTVVAATSLVDYLNERDLTSTPESVAGVTPAATTDVPDVAPPTAAPTFTPPPPPPTDVPVPPTRAPQALGGQMIFQDDFSDLSSGWSTTDFEAGEVGYGDGYYFASSDEAGGMVWGTASLSLDDTVIEVEATQISAPATDNNAYGVMCRVQPDEDGYLLRISGDGYYAIHRIVEGVFEALVDWTTSDVVNQGNASNRIRAVCDGTRLALFANGELLAEVDDTTFSEGDIGLTATTYDEGGTEVRFYNISVLAPGAASPVGRLVLQDDFSDPGSGWEVGDYDTGSVGYADGHYFVTSLEDGKTMWGLAYRNFAGVTIEVDASPSRAPTNHNNGYGVKCHVQSGGTGGDGYALLISGDGYYSIQLISEGDYEPLVEWTASSEINQGFATNRIRAVCADSRLALFVNDQFLAEVEDDTYSSGDISLMAVTLEDEPTEVHFDNLAAFASGPPLPGGGILFEDDFGDASSGWDIDEYDSGASVGYASGVYRILGVEDGIMAWGAAQQDLADLAIGVDATQVAAPANDNNGYGVMCRVQQGTSGDGYAFLVSGDGYYTIQIISKGDYEPLVQWESSDAIRQGNSTNHLRAVCDGTNLAFYVNGELMTEVQDATYATGDIALLAGTLEAEPTEVHFDNLVVSSPLP
jgi:serine/threonine-protein kinase